MKALLVNNLASDLLLTVVGTFSLVFHPARAYASPNGGRLQEVTCLIYLCFLFLGKSGNTFALPLFAVAVFFLTKNDIKKLKWCVIIVFFTASWAIAILLALYPSFVFAEQTSHINGFAFL